MAMKKCPECGEKYSDTYKRCPFCDEEQKIRKGKRVQKRNTKNGGSRAGSTDRENLLTLVLLVIMLILAGILLWLLFGGGSDDQPGGSSSSSVISSGSVSDPGSADNPGTENPGGTDDPGTTGMPEITEPNVDEIKALPETLTLNKADYTTNVGDVDVQLKVGDGTGVYTWVSADPSIAAVDSNGKVTAVGSGNVYVYATDGVGMGKCIVRVKGGSTGGSTGTSTPSAANAALNKTDITITVGEMTALRVKNYEGTVTWTAENSSIVSVLSDGTIKGLKVGTTNVIATVGDRTLKCIVRVKN